MPKRVDHEERRRQIAAALLRVVARDGLEAVSLRHVAAEAGVTAGMVQHYFPSKVAMTGFAMRAASARYEERIEERLGRLGDDPAPRQVLGVLLGALLPADAAEEDDARVALAFQAFAATHPEAAVHLEEGNALLREHLAALLRATGCAGDPLPAATGLLAAAEGLGVHMLSSRLPAAQARAALERMIDAAAGPA
ncbi:TetR/AcrR family transcriptional regulator [Microbacterium sp. No. 7]|uniref:TetR/AcrR family transcriptional regulator n=1 Tax=Microbacterium sp. No. 7 TaxID=1714373 RepID=UPI0006D20F6F|nr:TetR family transcriptional regulator C-terminal domain-containing protein [Microbacterium sp. No. 7]ALJ20866.1 TetR family transcriptional regulator [Microbacterium sp. No. 7]